MTDTPEIIVEKVPNRDFIRVGRSRIVGKGIFAKRKIPKGTRIIEYEGERVPKNKLFVEINEGKPINVYTFSLSDKLVIDGLRNGNESRFINHSCDPNCESYIFDERVYIYAMREITRGEELTFDYNLGASTKGAKKINNDSDYACHCGSANCRGTMLASKKTNIKK